MLITEKLRVKQQLSSAEQAVADFLLANGRDLDRYSTRDLADSAYTSPATVIRLCKKLGFSGFDDFKQRFLDEQRYLEKRAGVVDANFPFEHGDSPVRAANRIGQLYNDAVSDTLSLLHHSDLQKATRLLSRCRRAYVFSFGTALNQAETFRENMMKIGKGVSISNNLNYQLYECECLSSGDLAICISYSGETEKLLHIAKTCHERHVPIIGITSYGENSLTEYVDCKLTLSTKEALFDNAATFGTHISVCLLLDILYASLFLTDFDANYERRVSSTRELEAKRRSANELLMAEASYTERREDGG